MSRKHHTTFKVLNKEANQLIKQGDSAKIYNEQGKVKAEYLNIHTVHSLMEKKRKKRK